MSAIDATPSPQNLAPAGARFPLAHELGALMKLAAPIAAAQAGQTVMGLVDVAIVGSLGARPLGAIGLANSIFFFAGTLGMGAVMGLDPLTSQAIGAGDPVRARRLLWQGVWLALIASTVLGVGLLFAPLGLRPAGVPEGTAELTALCLGLRIVSMPGMLLFATMRAYLQAHGRTMPMVVSTIVCNVFNLLADLLLVFGGAHLPGGLGKLLAFIPAMGAAGAALSTTLGTFVQLAVVTFAVTQVEAVKLPAGARRPIPRDLLQAARVGLPIGLQMGAEVGVFALVTLLAARLGDASLAAHQLALTLASFSFSIALGIGNAGSVRVGWAVGFGDGSAARRAGLVAFSAGALVMVSSASCFLLAPHWLPHIFPSQREVLAVAGPLLGVAAFFQISDGVQGVGAGVLRGAGDTVFAFLANLVGHYLVGLPIALWFGLYAHQGIVGLWWGLCCGLTAVAVALFSRFLWLSSRPIRPLEPHAPALN